jgi:hypothetical protein
VKLDSEVCQLLAVSNAFRNPFWLAPTARPSLTFISWIVVLRLYLLPFPLRRLFRIYCEQFLDFRAYVLRNRENLLTCFC